MAITLFRGKYAYLSNFYQLPNHITIPSEYIYDGIQYMTVEHAYQAAKTTDIGQRHVIIAHKYAGDAKKYAYSLTLREDWEQIKRPIMLRLVRQKFAMNPGLRKQLLDTYPNELIEGNIHHDNYWGVCSCQACDTVGLNWLGRILMFVREGYLLTGS